MNGTTESAYSHSGPRDATGCFIADAMLGKLARWMRMLGCDVAYDRNIEDSRLVERATAENRLILTRDIHLIQRRMDPRPFFFFIRSDHLPDQLRQVVLDLNVSRTGRLLTRCIECNHLLVRVSWKDVVNRVPPYVARTQTRFSQCHGCMRIYWPGTHSQHISDRLRSVFSGIQRS
jgi:uncharacterized protein